MMGPFVMLGVGLLLAQCLSVNASEEIQGDLAVWNSIWHGVGHAQPEAAKLPRACPLIAEALSAAEQSHFEKFCSLFGVVDTNVAPIRLREMYDQWREGSRRYIYLIAQEAFLEASQNQAGMAAVAFVPAAMREGSSAAEAPIGPQVIFAKQEGAGWLLLHTAIDRKVEQFLIGKTAPFGYRRTVYTKEAIDRDIHRFHETRIDELRRSGASQAQIISAMERFQALEANVTAVNWTQWTNYYKVKILNPPVCFTNLEECVMDFKTPISACRSYKRAVIELDEVTLLKHADESGAIYLKKGTLQVAKSPGGGRSAITPTLVTLLLIAETNVKGRDYVMVLSREHNVQNPKDGMVFLQMHFFVHDRDRDVYLFTRDVESSSFAEILPAAKAVGTGIAKYPVWVDKMRKSLFPPHFYEIR